MEEGTPIEAEKDSGLTSMPNLWKRTDVPHSGWNCIDIIDLGSPSGICGMCGYQIIRYVHVMRHSEYPHTVNAGCVCAGNMEGDLDRARRRESDFKNSANRQQTFMSLAWKTSNKGNPYIKYKNRVIILLPDKYKPNAWKYSIDSNISELFETQDAAKLAAFKFIDETQ